MMDPLELVHEGVQEVKETTRRIEDKVDQLDVRLAVVEDRGVRRSAIVSAITGFLAGLLGRG